MSDKDIIPGLNSVIMKNSCFAPPKNFDAKKEVLKPGQRSREAGHAQDALATPEIEIQGKSSLYLHCIEICGSPEFEKELCRIVSASYS